VQNGRDLYFIQMRVTGAVKIGRSKDVERRLSELQVGSPHQLRILLVVPDLGYMEPRVHQKLGTHRLRQGSGEWFGPDCLWDLPVWLYDQLDLETQDWWKED
jgi:hypothetical protein